MDRQQLLKQLDKAWAVFKESYAGLSDSQLTEPGVTGQLVGERHYRARDVVGGRGAEASATHHHREAGHRSTRRQYGGIDAFNAQMTEQERGLSLSDVLRQMDETHRRLIAYVQSVPEEQFTRETRFRRRLRLDTYSHYPKHAKAIREWRERSAG